MKYFKNLLKLIFIIGILYGIHIITALQYKDSAGFWNIRFLYILSSIFVINVTILFYGWFCVIRNLIRKIREK